MVLIKRIIRFYVDGFRSMTIGKTLWLIIFIKLFIIFVLLRIFLFPDFLSSRFSSDQEKGDYVIDRLTH